MNLKRFSPLFLSASVGLSCLTLGSEANVYSVDDVSNEPTELLACGGGGGGAGAKKRAMRESMMRELQQMQNVRSELEKGDQIQIGDEQYQIQDLRPEVDPTPVEKPWWRKMIP